MCFLQLVMIKKLESTARHCRANLIMSPLCLKCFNGVPLWGQNPLYLRWATGPCVALPFSQNHFTPHNPLSSVPQPQWALFNSFFNKHFLVKNLPRTRQCSRFMSLLCEQTRPVSCPPRNYGPIFECSVLLAHGGSVCHTAYTLLPLLLLPPPFHTLSS